ncbi:hypothetical protein [Stenotrophomonas muris]|uniref:hypothetical protein n=1 Tax=Stenotrophomonas muris TaxID=2963283 RepID=UPI0040554EDA
MAHDTFLTAADGTMIQYGPRREDHDGEMLACDPLDKGAVWSVYVMPKDTIGFTWVADCDNLMTAGLLANALKDYHA